MNTKICKRCGWEYPITQLGNVCKICGEQFDVVVCRMCGAIVTGDERVTNTNLCKECKHKFYNASSKKTNAKVRKANEERFDAWLEKVKKVPKGYPTLTETQWLEACTHFNGCARCHSEEIDTRGFFVGMQLGGRYCDWNVIPLCERCAKTWDLQANPFIITRWRDHNRNKNLKPGDKKSDDCYEYRDSLDNIVKYLEVKLDHAIGHETDADRDEGCVY